MNARMGEEARERVRDATDIVQLIGSKEPSSPRDAPHDLRDRLKHVLVGTPVTGLSSDHQFDEIRVVDSHQPHSVTFFDVPTNWMGAGR